MLQELDLKQIVSEFAVATLSHEEQQKLLRYTNVRKHYWAKFGKPQDNEENTIEQNFLSTYFTDLYKVYLKYLLLCEGFYLAKFDAPEMLLCVDENNQVIPKLFNIVEFGVN